MWILRALADCLVRGGALGLAMIVIYELLRRLPVGTKSLLFGVHAFYIHPFVVALAWKRLYGFPTDPRVWVAFIGHDWGYWGMREMDSPEAEKHVELGASIMHKLFDRPTWCGNCSGYPDHQVFTNGAGPKPCPKCHQWGNFSLYHSRFYAKKNGAQFSRLCVADKAAIYTDPYWFYMLRARLSGEIYEYLAQQPKIPYGLGQREQFKWWHAYVIQYLIWWVNEHKDCKEDTWTSKDGNRETDLASVSAAQ